MKKFFSILSFGVTRTDIFLAAGFLALAAAFLLALNLFARDTGNLYAAIYVDGELTQTAEFNRDAEDIEIRTARGFNLISVHPDGVAVTRADCPSGDCVRAGKIRGYGRSVCCLPHRLLIRIEADGEGDFDIDAVAR